MQYILHSTLDSLYAKVKNPQLYKYGAHAEYSGAAPSANEIKMECKKPEGMPSMKPVAAEDLKARSKRRAWIAHIKQVQKEHHGASYKEAMVLAQKTWRRTSTPPVQEDSKRASSGGRETDTSKTRSKVPATSKRKAKSASCSPPKRKKNV